MNYSFKQKIVPIGSELSILEKILFYGLAAFLGLSIIGAFVGKASIIVTMIIIFFFVIFLTIPLHDSLTKRKVKKAATILNELIEEVKDGEFRFIKPLKARKIIYKSTGRITWIRGPVYTFRANIIPKGEYEIGNIHRFEDLSYGIVIGKRGIGYFILPGLEFDEPELRNIVLLYIPSKQPLIEGLTKRFNFFDKCTVEIKIHKGNGLHGEAMLNGKCKASLYLTTRFFDEYLKFRLADLKNERKVHFSSKLSLEKPVLIVARKRSSPRALAKSLSKNIIVGDEIPYILLIETKKGLKKFKCEVKLKTLGLT